MICSNGKELDRLKRSSKSSASNENKNNSKKLKWFMTTIQELRQEIQDINFSKQLLDKQNYANDLEAVRKDVEVLRRDMETTKAEITKINQDVQMLVQDKDERENSIEPILPDPRYRNGKLFLKTKHHLEKEQHALNHKVKTLQSINEEILQRISHLESSNQNTVKSMANITKQVSGVEHLHSSMMELLESIETVENKVDYNLPTIQREISKLEFGVAQINSTLIVVNETRDSDANYMKSMVSTLATLQEKVEANNILTQALRTGHPTGLSPFSVQDIQSSSMSPEDILQQMNSIHDSFMQVVGKLPEDCSGPAGLQLISLGRSVLCDSNHWMTIQRRYNGMQEFNLHWDEYATGFGAPDTEFWVGNEALHKLTNHANMSLRIEFDDIYSKSWYAEYDTFTVSSAEDGYRLNIGGYHGNASDAMSYQNGMKFSTIDRDNDLSNSNCASNYEGGWWFSHCLHVNLNGKFNLGLTWFHADKNEWIAVASSQMKIRRRQR
uniref:Protein scabrous n=2 Tax=Cacopsylla melanoneura TaxID=428564 RepID=A0A8D8TAW2_9HEMI